MTNIIKLSNRLRTAASFLDQGAVFADIGSDHAYLPCYVCQHDDNAQAIAGEISKGPYTSAVESVQKHKLTSKIDVRIGDGLEVLKKDEVNHIVIAGMGGTLITSILENGKQKLDKVDRIITQPNVDERSIRRWFLANGYVITHESILEENGHIYEVIVADKLTEKDLHATPYTEKQLLFGPILLQKQPSLFKNKWEKELDKRSRVVSQLEKAKVKDELKAAEYRKEMKWIEEVLCDDTSYQE
ncbi:tRNA (adenine(22)-N(1))-methyltransferase [Virgibacillus siamensis]|uniref:tRNA (adenine(22)-N(1))-methyltransferase n=1 Tax=Virgibacillus siamensis TaxID=480071 RepID=UPI0009845349|nr:tRNA (adenine(22)-N(1))-methyltransferase TrmK [Virgibacillus siamensis]